MDSKIYNQTGKEVGSIKLPESVFGVKWNGDLVHQVITSIMSSRRKPWAHTKFRGEVRGGGKKPWRQKGTGRARHGSTRSPLWSGGGVTHGPRKEKNYERTVTRGMKAKALGTILSAKFRDGEILFVDSLNISAPKTKEAKEILKSLGGIKGFESLATKRKNTAYIGSAGKKAPVWKSFANFGNIFMEELRNINPADLINYKYLIIENPEKTLKFLEQKFKS